MPRIYDGDKHVALEAEKTRLQNEIQVIATRMNDEYQSDAWGGEDGSGKMARYQADNIKHMQLGRELQMVDRDLEKMEEVRPLSSAERNANPILDIRRRWCMRGADMLDEGERQIFMPEMTDQMARDLERRGVPTNGEFFDPWAIATNYSETRLPGTALSRRRARMAGPSTSDGTGASTSPDTNLSPAAPEVWAAGVVESLQYYGSVASNCHNFNTSDGNKFHQNALDTKDQEGTLIVDQSQTAGTGTPPSAIGNIGQAKDVVFDSYWRTSDFIESRIEVFSDIHFDVASRVMREMERRLGRGWNRTFTVGGGGGTATGAAIDQPQGIALSGLRVAGGAGSADDGSGGIDYQNLLDMEYAVDLAYLMSDEGGPGGFMDAHGGMIGWMMHRNVEKQLRLATMTTSGLPIWVPDPSNIGAAIQRAPGMILGYPYTINNHMGTGKKPTDSREYLTKSSYDQDKTTPLLFGACGHFGVRNIGGPMYYRFWDSETAKRMAVKFIGWSRRDSRSRGPHAAPRQVTAALDGFATGSTTVTLNEAYCTLSVGA